MSGTTPNRSRTARSPTGIAAHRPLTALPNCPHPLTRLHSPHTPIASLLQAQVSPRLSGISIKREPTHPKAITTKMQLIRFRCIFFAHKLE